jgi:hypothetical protein
MRSLLTKIKSLIKRGYVSRASANNSFYQIMQVSYLGKTGDAEYISPYGLYSNCPVDTPVLLWNLQSFENNRAGMPFSEDDRFKNLAVGEVKVGNPVTGSYVYFKADGKIEIESKSEMDISINGNVNLTASGNVNVNASQTNLGTGGNKIARLGDEVTVDISGTPYTGTITTAGNNTSI